MQVPGSCFSIEVEHLWVRLNMAEYVETSVSGMYIVIGAATAAAILLLLVECFLAGLGVGVKMHKGQGEGRSGGHGPSSASAVQNSFFFLDGESATRGDRTDHVAEHVFSTSGSTDDRGILNVD